MLSGINERLVPSALISKIGRPVSLSGGTEVDRNGMRYHVITSSMRLYAVNGGVVYALIVAAGGSRHSGNDTYVGGGGGGGLANYLPISVPTGSYILVTVGSAAFYSNGGDSSVECLRPAQLTGGGAGGQSGGCGGGAGFAAAAGSGNSPSFTPSQGFRGGPRSDGSNGGGGGGFGGETTRGNLPPLQPLGKNGGVGLALDADTVSLGPLIGNATHFSSGGGGDGDNNLGGSTGAGGPGAGDGGYGFSNTSATWFGCGAGGGPNVTVGMQGIVIIKYPI
jgi:hypothetical protein